MDPKSRGRKAGLFRLSARAISDVPLFDVDVHARCMDIDAGFARPRNAVVIDNRAIVVLDAFLHAGSAVANRATNAFGTGTLRQSERSGGSDDANCRYVAHTIPPIFVLINANVGQSPESLFVPETNKMLQVVAGNDFVGGTVAT
jgi:hypothetical protein